MCSSAIAPSRHFATVTIRPPPANSPTTQVHSPDPNVIGWDVTCAGVPPLAWTKRLHGFDVLPDAVSRWLSVDLHDNVVGV